MEGQGLQIHIAMGSVLSSGKFRTISKNGTCPLPLMPASRISLQEWFSTCGLQKDLVKVGEEPWTLPSNT